MTKTYCSNYIKKNAMDKDDVLKLEAEIAVYNYFLKRMVSDLGKPRPKDPSIHVEYKGYGMSDYLVTSLERTAHGIRESAAECLKLNIQEKESQIKQAESKIRELQKQIENMQTVKNSLIDRSRARKENSKLPPVKNYFNSGIYVEDGKNENKSFVLDYDRHKKSKKKRDPMTFENEYLFELKYVDPYIRKKKRQINQIQGRIHNLKSKLEKLKHDRDAKQYHICFGGKALMRKRATTEDIDSWRRTFEEKRLREMVLVGRYDATQGNFMVKYDTAKRSFVHTTISGRQITLPGVVFPYGQENIDMAVNASKTIKKNKKLPPNQQIPCWDKKPVTWSIKDCGNAFLVKCTIDVPENQNMNSDFSDGCVAFDMNYDHLAVSELNKYGQLLKHDVVHFKVTGRTSNQIDNAISEALEKVFKWAEATKKPIAMENIEDLQKELMYGNAERNRKISQFAYNKMETLAASKSQKYGIVVKAVNPAYTSQTGKLKYMKNMGLSIHEAASFVIGRRAMGFDDKVPKALKKYISKKTLRKPRWAHWSALTKSLKSIPVSCFYKNIDYNECKNLTALKKALIA